MTTRRLAAILAADVVGSSRLIEADEGYALTAIREVLHDVLVGTAASHGGRLIKTMGDGALLEFASPVAAVTCATAVQSALAERAAIEPEDRRVLLRIGVNLGDVVAQTDGDLYGDGVNIAARLESIASPGGIAISGKVHEELQGKVGLVFEDRGEQSLKNVARPVRVYALGGSDAPKAVLKPRSLPLPDKPSIAVLPFTNMSGDPEQEYFADGVVEDIITALSRFKWLFVIARNSSFTYKGRAVDVKQVGRELGVRYVLEGSIRKSGNRVRIAAQLVEGSAGGHLWADRFEGALDDIFGLQDQVTGGVVGAISPKLEQAEIDRARGKPTEDLQAYDYYLRGVASLRRSGGTCDEALNLFRTAIRLDPNFAAAYGMAAFCYWAPKAWSRIADREREVAEVNWLVRQVEEVGRDDAVALTGAGSALAYVVGDVEGGAALLDRALALNPNDALAWLLRGCTFVWLGDSERAIDRFMQAMRLSPLDPSLIQSLSGMAHAHFHAERYEEAIFWGEKALRERPGSAAAARITAAANALAGRMAHAQFAIKRVRKLAPALRVSNLRATLGPYTPDRYARYEKALRLAGLPE
jgi:TolB-like protein/tetratricopeptide (TPR) repeat protein